MEEEIVPSGKYFRQGPMQEEIVPSGKYFKNPEPEGWISGGARTAASGLTEGAAALVGLPTTLFNASQIGMTKLLGGKPMLAPDVYGAVKNKASELTGGYTDYTPETFAGRATKNVLSFAPTAATAALTGGTSLVPTLVGGALVPGVAGEVAREGGEGIATALKMDNPEQVGQYAKLGAEILSPMGASKALPSLGKKLANPALQTTVDDLAKLEQFGVNVTPGSYRTSQKAARDAIGKEAGLSGPSKTIAGQADQFSKGVLRDVGITDDLARSAGFAGGLSPANAQRVTEHAIKQLGPQIGSVYSNVRRRNFSPSDWSEIEYLVGQMPKLSKYDPSVMKSGDWMHAVRQEANKIVSEAQGASHGPSFKPIAEKLIEKIDGAVQQSLGPAAFADLQSANSQYSRLLTTRDALDRAASNGRAGQITAQDILAVSGTRHTQDLTEIAKIADNYLLKMGVPITEAAKRSVMKYIIDAAGGIGSAGLSALMYGVSPSNLASFVMPAVYGAAGTAGAHLLQKGLRLAKGSRYAQNVAKSKALYGKPMAPMMAAPVAVGAADREGRRSGGRVSSHEADADQLVRAAERAKKGWSAKTEPLLNQSDETVVKALAVANRSI